jgi:hypothetical protein
MRHLTVGFLLLVFTNIQTITSFRLHVILNFGLHRLRLRGSNPHSFPLIMKLNNSLGLAPGEWADD